MHTHGTILQMLTCRDTLTNKHIVGPCTYLLSMAATALVRPGHSIKRPTLTHKPNTCTRTCTLADTLFLCPSQALPENWRDRGGSFIFKKPFVLICAERWSRAQRDEGGAKIACERVKAREGAVSGWKRMGESNGKRARGRKRRGVSYVGREPSCVLEWGRGWRVSLIME